MENFLLLFSSRNRIIILGCIVGVLFTFFVGILVMKSKSVSPQEASQSTIKKSIKSASVNFVPKKTDYGTSTPPGFSAAIPIEKKAKLSTSYTQEYQNLAEKSIVFASQKTVEENFLIYKNFLKSEKWKILSSTSTVKRASLFATKEKESINVVIFKSIVKNSSEKSHVAVTVLKK